MSGRKSKERENKEKGTKNMKKMNNKRGFTLAELLIVVAIIAVLVAIAIPIFNTQLEKSRDAVDEANIRAAYAELTAALIPDDGTGDSLADLGLNTNTKWTAMTGTATNGTFTYTFSGKGQDTGWGGGSTATTDIGGLQVTNAAKATTLTFTVTSGKITGISMNT